MFKRTSLKTKCGLASILDNYDSAIDNGVTGTLPFRTVINYLYAKEFLKK